MVHNIAIDGPAGAGKSTVAQKVAKELSFVYVDTGAMYRAMALYLLRKGVNREEPDEIGEACQNAEISIEYQNGEQIVLLDGENVNAHLRTEEVRPYYEALQQHRGSLVLKRIFDFTASLVMFCILLPFMIVIGILVGTTSRGGVFFCQERVTTNGRTFKIIKFRTMVANAEKLGSQVTTNRDSRVTAVGRFLRKVRLDELPQIINILKGDMSFVGTRPEVPGYVKGYTKEMMATLLLPAGVTSEASIEYKDEERLLMASENVDETYINEVLPQKMQYNLDYLKDYSFGKDLKIMLKTVAAVCH